MARLPLKIDLSKAARKGKISIRILEKENRRKKMFLDLAKKLAVITKKLAH